LRPGTEDHSWRLEHDPQQAAVAEPRKRISSTDDEGKKRLRRRAAEKFGRPSPCTWSTEVLPIAVRRVEQAGLDAEAEFFLCCVLATGWASHACVTNPICSNATVRFWAVARVAGINSKMPLVTRDDRQAEHFRRRGFSGRHCEYSGFFFGLILV